MVMTQALCALSQGRFVNTARNVLRQSGGVGGGGGIASSGGGGGGGGAGGGGLWPTYLRLLERSPLFTKAWTAGLLNGLGDAVSQKFVEKNDNFDFKRLGIFTLLGSVLVGPGLHFWYSFIGRTVTATGTAGKLPTCAVIRLALDQLLWAPVFISTFLASLLTLEGKGHEVKSKLKNDLKPTVIANWKLWVPAQFINFRLVPPHLQVAFSNVIAVGWNTYLSWASHHSPSTSSPVEPL
ncbi:MAG: Peroxisomal membrane MPV17 and related s (ISS) [Trebouxia sp. A1-2]|nr:MAG: Peroxisomal membrane MPV17 and related s (ISS) [Trebouxia sp. A1-2]